MTQTDAALRRRPPPSPTPPAARPTGLGHPRGPRHHRLVRPAQGARPGLADHAGRRDHRADRAVRLRQVDVPAHPQPDARAGARRPRWPARCCSTARTSTTRSASSPTPAGSIGMVFQKPNPFPAMSIHENVLAGLKLTGTKVARSREGRARRGVPDPRPGSGRRSRTGSTARRRRCPAASSSGCASRARWPSSRACC